MRPPGDRLAGGIATCDRRCEGVCDRTAASQVGSEGGTDVLTHLLHLPSSKRHAGGIENGINNDEEVTELTDADPPHCPNDAPDCRPTDCPFCHEEPA